MSEEILELAAHCHTSCSLPPSLYSSLPGEAINRLKKFFPIAETDTVIGVLQASPNEGRAVKRLLELGFPLRKIPIPRA